MNHGRGGRTKEQEAAASQPARNSQMVRRDGMELQIWKRLRGERRNELWQPWWPFSRAHMGQQETQDEEQREIVARQEQRFRMLQYQFQMLQLEVQVQTFPVPDLLLMDSDLYPEALPPS